MNCKCGTRMHDVGTAAGGIYVRWCPNCGRLYCRSMSPHILGSHWHEPKTIVDAEMPGHPGGCMCAICVACRIEKAPDSKCDRCGRMFKAEKEGAAADLNGLYCIPCGKEKGII